MRRAGARPGIVGPGDRPMLRTPHFFLIEVKPTWIGLRDVARRPYPSATILLVPREVDLQPFFPCELPGRV